MTTRKVKPAEANRILKGLAEELEESPEVAHAWAEAVLRQAQGIAATKPTPQARMAAEAFGVREGTILSLSGGDPGEVAAGSEFGSGIYTQFGPRNTRGYWLFPAANNPDPSTIAAGEEALDQVIEAAIRGF